MVLTIDLSQQAGVEHVTTTVDQTGARVLLMLLLFHGHKTVDGETMTSGSGGGQLQLQSSRHGSVHGARLGTAVVRLTSIGQVFVVVGRR